MRLISIAFLCLALVGCGILPSLPKRAAAPSEPLPFKTRLISGDDTRTFAVAVEGGNVGLEASRESVRFGGTRYCLSRFGMSDIEWTAPAGAPQQWTGQRFSDGSTVYTGTCIGR